MGQEMRFWLFSCNKPAKAQKNLSAYEYSSQPLASLDVIACMLKEHLNVCESSNILSCEPAQHDFVFIPKATIKFSGELVHTQVLVRDA